MEMYIEDLTAEIIDDRIVCSFWIWEDGCETVSNIDHFEIKPSVLANWVDDNYREDENFHTSLYMVENLKRLVGEYLEEQFIAA